MFNKNSAHVSAHHRNRQSQRLAQEPIAIIGVSGVFAQAQDIKQYWQNVFDKVDAIVDVPPSRWAIDDFYSPNKADPDKTYCKKGGFLPDIDFDPLEFGLPPHILEVTDVAQLLSLVVARDALEDAGMADEKLKSREKTGVILGVGGGQKLYSALTSRLQYPILERVLQSHGVDAVNCNIIIDKFKKAYVPWEENSFPGMLGNVIAGRVANRLNLGGTNAVVDAACASSLAAIKMAISELSEHRADTMITGGVCCDNSPLMYLSFSKTPAFSARGISAPFDQSSDGMLIGEGIGMVVLKRLADAERDNDRVYAVIRGMGTSSDGKFKSIYAPSPTGQVQALNRAYEDAGFEPATVGLLEAHGTGTAAGDLAEFQALNQVFAQNNPQRQHIALGSVKSQIGHTKAAAGIASVIKAALSLYHKVLPATINIDQPKTALNIESTPFYLNTETRPWLVQGDTPRRAGISSFGFGGTNFHLVLEEHDTQHQGRYRMHNPRKSVVFFAGDKTTLTSRLSTLLQRFSADDGAQQYAQFIAEYQLIAAPKEQPRVGFVLENQQQALQVLQLAISGLKGLGAEQQWQHPKGIFYRANGADVQGAIAALFPGQGSQYANMAKDLLLNLPPVLHSVSDMAATYQQACQKSLVDVLYPRPGFVAEQQKLDDEALRDTRVAQPAIGAVSAGLYQLFQQAGFKADFVAGHSFGELTALWAAGVLNDESFRQLAVARGQAMGNASAQGDKGAMLAVVGARDLVEAQLADFNQLSIANDNSDSQLVIAGASQQIDQLAVKLAATGVKTIKLPVSGAFHTPFFKEPSNQFSKVLDATAFANPVIKVFSNITGEAYENKGNKIKDNFKRHMLSSVKFRTEIENMYAQGARVFIEFGPKNVLTRLVHETLAGKDVLAVALNESSHGDSDLQLRKAVAQLVVYGVKLNDIDGFGRAVHPAPRQLSKLAIKLNGASYVSEKTKAAYQDALLKSPQIVAAQLQTAETAHSRTNTQHQGMRHIDSDLAVMEQQQTMLNLRQQHDLAYQNEAVGLVAGISRLQQGLHAGDVTSALHSMLHHHEEMGRRQAEFIDIHNRQSRLIVDLIQQKYPQVAKGDTQHLLVAPVSKQEFMVAGTDTTNLSVQPQTLVQPDPVRQTPPQHQVHTQSIFTTDSVIHYDDVQQLLLEVVSEQTGYPVGMFELSMQLQADLGIDKVKQSGIMQRMQQRMPQLSVVAPVVPDQLHTLAQLAEYLYRQLQPGVAAPATVQTRTDVMPQIDTITKAMMKAVADKTGYPEEMLEPLMDMEADLGIDSIKRVEILGAVQSALPALPELDTASLGRLRTLADVIAYLGQLTQSTLGLLAAAPAIAGAATADIQQAMLNAVADKTGYPVDMLELSMDMEADLGIDSIKRVEILGAVQKAVPQLPEVDSSVLGQLRTLADVVAYLHTLAGAVTAVAAVQGTQMIKSVASSGLPAAAITSAMMTAVSDKTGYPVDMLELSMDLEADLGIDSIKRVEILGAVQSALPQLPEVENATLAQLRTLHQVVDYLHQLAGTVTSPVLTTSTELPPPGAAADAVLSATAKPLPLAQIQAAMLKAVSEKTGYPIDMLELSMDMEADLGIDSIKRVEILGAVQAAQPLLAEADSAHLSGLRTLQDVVTYLNEFSTPAAESAAVVPAATLVESAPLQSSQTLAQPAAAGAAELVEITGIMLAAVAEKTGYPVDMLELTMDMEGDLGIDSIKRVEIMGAVRQAVPGLAEFDAGALAELRTLDQVAAYLTGLLGSELLTAPQGTSPVAAPAVVSVASAVLKPLPELKSKAVKQSNQPVCLLTDDGSDVSQVLFSRMKKLGWHVKVASFEAVAGLKTKLKVDNADLVMLHDMAAAKVAIEAIHQRYGGLDAFIYLQPALSATDASGSQASEQVLKQLFLTAGLLKHPLTDGAKLEKPAFITVNRLDGQLGYGTGLQSNPVQGAVFGLVKTLAQEWPQVQCKALDIAPQITADAAAEQILLEMQHDDGVVEIGFGPQGRVTVETTQSHGNDSYPLSGESVLLVSAGGRGVTASCIQALAQQQSCRFILVGRSTLTAEEPGWAQGIVELAKLKQSALADAQQRGEKLTPKALGSSVDAVLAQREIQNTINQLRKCGAKVVYISADITDPTSLAGPMREAEALLGKVTAIVHGAGVLADKLIEHKTASDFDRVFNTKIQGLKTMLSCVDPELLTHLALFSSVAGFYGNVGQSDYAMANEAMNKMAMDFGNRHPACRVVSFNWGPWDGGMVTDELKKLFEARQISLIPVAEGCAIFCNKMLRGNHTDRITVVGQTLSQQPSNPTQKTALLSKEIKASDNPFLQDHRIGNNAVLPVVMALTWMANDVESLYPGYRFYKCEQFRLFKGLVFDGRESGFYQLQADELSRDGDDLVVQVRIFSDNGKGGYFNHYGARLTLSRSANLPAAHYQAFDSRDQAVATGRDLYQGDALFHGPTFQAIESVLNWDWQHMTLKCKEKTADARVQGQFPVLSFNPYVADVEFQGLLVWVHQFYQSASLPSDGGELVLYRPVPAGEEYYVSLEIVEHNKNRVVADIYVHDGSGQLYTRMLGAAVAVSPQLARLFAV